MSADCYQEVFPDEEVYFVGEKRFILIAESIEEDKGVVEEVFYLGNLFIVEAVLDRKRVYSHQVDQIIKFIFLRTEVVKPYKAAFPESSNSFRDRFNPVKQAGLRKMIKP